MIISQVLPKKKSNKKVSLSLHVVMIYLLKLIYSDYYLNCDYMLGVYLNFTAPEEKKMQKGKSFLNIFIGFIR
jgi:hypothetical protein